MSRGRKIGLILAGSLAGLILLVAVTGLVLVQTDWFRETVRHKIISSVEEATGGRVEVGTFAFDWKRLRAEIRNFVVHGLEPADAAPLLRADLIQVDLKLTSPFTGFVDLAYLLVERPQANVMVMADGNTNIPEPKIKKPAGKPALETIVDLAVARFDLRDGSFAFAQRATNFNASGSNLRARLDYNRVQPRYTGEIDIQPLQLRYQDNPALPVDVKLPLTIRKDAIALEDARLRTPQSEISITGDLANLTAAMRGTVAVNASLSVDEIRRAAGLDLGLNTKGAPGTVKADLKLVLADNQLRVQKGQVTLGASRVDLSGSLQTQPMTGSVQFDVDLALAELARLFQLDVKPQGTLQAGGNVVLGPGGDYRVTANVQTRNVSVATKEARISNVELATGVTAVPDRIDLSGLRLNAQGSSVAGNATLTAMRNLQFQGELRQFNLSHLDNFGVKNPGYSGVISGPVRVAADLKNPSSLTAEARLRIVPASGGIPVSGQINANYNGKSGAVTVARSYLALPHTRLDLAGSLGRQIDVHAVSRDLRDFAPLAPDLPVKLNPNGSVTLDAAIRGSATSPQITGHAAASNFSYQGQTFTNLSADLGASPAGVSVTNGILSRGTMQAQFAATVPLRNWKPETTRTLLADLNLRGADMKDLLALAGKPDLPITGTVTLTAHLTGTVNDPRGTIAFTAVNGRIDGEPYDRISARPVLDAGVISIPDFEFLAGPSKLNASATYRHAPGDLKQGALAVRAASNRIQLAQLQSLVKDRPGLGGALEFNADMAASIYPRNGTTEFQVTAVNGKFTARALQMEGKALGDLTATASTSSNTVQYTVDSNFAGSTVRVNGRSLLTGAHDTTATVGIQRLPIERVLAVAGQRQIPVTGMFGANAQLSGTLDNPRGSGTFTVTNGTAYGEPLALEATAGYGPQVIELPSLRVTSGGAQLQASASYSHAAGNLQSGSLKFRAQSNRIDLARFRELQKRIALGGTVDVSAEGAADLRPNAIPLFSSLNAELDVRRLTVQGKPSGNLNLAASTSGQEIALQLTSDIGGADVRGSGTVSPTRDYLTHAQLTFANLKYSGLRPFLGGGAPDAVEAVASGRASINGPATRIADLTGELRVDTLNVHSASTGAGAKPRTAVEIHNNGPMVITLARSVVTVQNVRLTGPYTNLALNGTAPVDGTGNLNLRAEGNVDLEAVEAFSPNIFANGNVSLNATVTGNTSRPVVNGTLALQNANFNMLDLPSGLSKGNGVIRFTGTGAVIQNLTGELGGGRVTVTGFADYGGTEMTFRLQASVNHARIQYPENVSTEASARITLAGSSASSSISGDATIHDVAFFSHSDMGSILSSAATPQPVQTTEQGLLAGMRFDVRIRTAPGTELRTTLTENVQVDADLRLRGSVARPGMLGRVQVTSGDVTFFGAKYNIDQGLVNFYDPNRISPELNVDLETKVQGINVSLRVSGPMDRLKLTYHSDPPLQFSEIVSLLATGKASVTDPVLAARQPVAPEQNFQQMGASALLSQTVANPVAGRLQRLFGVTRLKIDPKLVSGSSTPQATVTLQQQITHDLTFTYIQDVTQTNPQTIRVEWSINSEWSAVVERDYNGSVDLDLFYKRRFW